MKFAARTLRQMTVVSWGGWLATTGVALAAAAAASYPRRPVRIVGQGMEPVGNTPPQIAALIKQEITKYAALVKPAARPE